MLVTVSSFRDPYEAHLLRGRLETEGILAFVNHEYWIANEWPMSIAFGGVKDQVSSDEIELAREIDQACRDGEFRELLRAELGDLDDTVCPHCGSAKFRKRRPLPRAALAVVVSFCLALVVPPTGWILSCGACGKSFRAPHRPFSRSKAALVASLMVGVMIAGMALLHWI